MNIPDHISESFYADPDPGSRVFLALVSGSGMEKFGSGMEKFGSE
jgi:hypothetical protein